MSHQFKRTEITLICTLLLSAGMWLLLLFSVLPPILIKLLKSRKRQKYPEPSHKKTTKLYTYLHTKEDWIWYTIAMPSILYVKFLYLHYHCGTALLYTRLCYSLFHYYFFDCDFKLALVPTPQRNYCIIMIIFVCTYIKWKRREYIYA